MLIATKKKRVSTRTRPKTPTPMGTTEQELSSHSLNMVFDDFLFNLSPNCDKYYYYLLKLHILADGF